MCVWGLRGGGGEKGPVEGSAGAAVVSLQCLQGFKTMSSFLLSRTPFGASFFRSEVKQEEDRHLEESPGPFQALEARK